MHPPVSPRPMNWLESGLLFRAIGWAGFLHSTGSYVVSTQVLRHTILSQENRKHATILRVTLHHAEVLFATSEGYRRHSRKGAWFGAENAIST